MNKLSKFLLAGVAGAGLFLGGAALVGPASAVSTTPGVVPGTTIPHCVNDDYNDGTQYVCWTQRTDNQVIIINKNDTIAANMSGEASLNLCSFYGYVGNICKFPDSTSPTGYGIQSANGAKYYPR